MKWIFLPALVFITVNTCGQSFIQRDTSGLNKKNFSDSLSIKQLIDQVFDHKEENLQHAIDLGAYALNRACEIKNKRLQAGALNLMAACTRTSISYCLSLITG